MQTVETPARAWHEARLGALEAALATGESWHARLAALRLAMVAATALVAWWVFSRQTLAVVWLLLPLGSFAALVLWHAVVLNAQDRRQHARAWHARGLARLSDDWQGQGDDGRLWLDASPLAADLDLCGAGSLFQLLNTAQTDIGAATLAAWLITPASADEIARRQEAVRELGEAAAFRETLAVVGAGTAVSHAGALVRWASGASHGFTRGHARLAAAAAIVSAVAVGAAATGLLPSSVVFVWLAVQALIASRIRHSVHRVVRAVDAAAHELGLLAALLDCIEATSFRAPLLRELQGTIRGASARPSRQLRRLRRLIAARDALRNELLRPIGALLLVRTQLAIAIDRWHSAHGDHVVSWVRAVGALEALASVATYAHEHPDHAWPVVADGPPRYDARGLAHALLPYGAVSNDVALGHAAPPLLLVSGSNMSGKSTLLRAVGLSVVLTHIGAPVRATALTLTPLALGVSIRISDSVQSGTSRFYAELQRLRSIVDAADCGPCLFLLDEVLAGTNSHDRRIGADALFHRLTMAGAIGIATTHDLALTHIADAVDAPARNAHFEDQVVDDRLAFDYVLRPGVATRSNALALMRAVGVIP